MTWLTILLWGLGILAVIIAVVAALIVLFVIFAVKGDRPTADNDLGFWDPPVAMPGDYPAGVEFRLPEPADQQHDSDAIPKLDKNWPGLTKPKRRAF